MKVILFGATGMIGQGVLTACLREPTVKRVLSIVRTPGAVEHPRLHEHVHDDFLDFSALEDVWRGYDACFYCLGVSSAGMNEADYRRITYDFALAAARPLAALNPNLMFVFISGVGTDDTEQGRTMWARVKGATENAIRALPFRSVAFRPGAVIPVNGERSKATPTRVAYAVSRPLWRPLLALFPRAITTTERIAHAMLFVAQNGAPKPVLEPPDINDCARSWTQTGTATTA